MTGLALFVTVTMMSGCEIGGDSRMLSVHLVDHFRKNGFEGRFRRSNAEAIGAEQAGRYVLRRKFDVEFAKFEDKKKARRFRARGFNGYKIYLHGRYIMLIRNVESEAEIVKVFRKF